MELYVVQQIMFVGKKSDRTIVKKSSGFQFAGFPFAFIGGTTPNWEMTFFFAASSTQRWILFRALSCAVWWRRVRM
jgi:hypothetical protein